MTRRHNFETLNLLRGIAALTVLVWHFPLVDERRYWSAYLSVDLFFVLSGVVVAHAYEARLAAGWRFWRFATARIIRLWPLYLLGSAIGAVASAVVVAQGGLHAWRFKSLLSDVAHALVLWPHAEAGGVVFPLDRPAWSLFCELAVNLVYGAALVRLPSRWLVPIIGAGALAMTAGAVRFEDVDTGLNLGALHEHLWVGLARAGYSFPVGVLLYRAWVAGRLPRIAMRPATVCGFFLLLLVAVPGQGRWSTIAALGATLVVLPLLVAAAMQVEPTGRTRWLARVTSDLSYPIYVLHDAMFMAAAAVVETTRLPRTPTCLAAAMATLLLAPLADRYVDRPVRRRLTRLVDMPRRAVTAASPL